MVEVPKYAEIQKYAGPVFIGALAYWLLPLPDPLPRFRAWAALGAIASGSILAWTLLLRGIAVHSAKRQAAEARKQEETHAEGLRNALLNKLRSLAPDERDIIIEAYKDPNHRLRASPSWPPVIQLQRSKIIHFLCTDPDFDNTAFYTLAPVVRRQIDHLGIAALSGSAPGANPAAPSDLSLTTDSD